MFKARMRFAKEGRAKYISHLDLMRTMQRSMARCEMPLWFTEGFNQHAYVSVALPLATGHSGEWELLDFSLLSETISSNAVKSLNAVFPEGLRAIEIYPVSDNAMPIREIAWSRYQFIWIVPSHVNLQEFVSDVTCFFQQPSIEILKRSKRGEKLVNMKDFMFGTPRFSIKNGLVVVQTVTSSGNNNMSPEYLTRAIMQFFPQYQITAKSYHRLCVYNTQMLPFR